MSVSNNIKVIHQTGCHWYAYKHVNGEIHAKRYFDDKDIKEAFESDFVSEVLGPIEGTKEDALNLFKGE